MDHMLNEDMAIEAMVGECQRVNAVPCCFSLSRIKLGRTGLEPARLQQRWKTILLY